MNILIAEMMLSKRFLDKIIDLGNHFLFKITTFRQVIKTSVSVNANWIFTKILM